MLGEKENVTDEGEQSTNRYNEAPRDSKDVICFKTRVNIFGSFQFSSLALGWMILKGAACRPVLNIIISFRPPVTALPDQEWTRVGNLFTIKFD